MNTRKLVNLFLKTLALGAVVTIIVSFFVNSGDYAMNLNPINWFGLLGLVLWFAIYGMLYSVISQAGFFAYLFINRFGLGLFRSFWPTTQILLIAFVLFDLVYFPYKASGGDVSVWWYILMSAAILGFGLVVASIKAKETHKRAFIPALFFMVVMTSVEWVPALRTDGTAYAWLMIAALLACNTYQILILHRLTGSDKGQDRKNKKSTGAKSKIVKA